ncbi:MAG: ABC transporter permease [Phycisphaerales bacterium]|nr:FtsX-like permease family protein [Planctomycetota bacterium]
MYWLALKMLFNDKAKFFGIVMGVTLASLVITQQGSIFIGILSRTFGVITDMNYPEIWVMDPKVQFIDDTKPLQDTKLFEVRGVPGVASAVPLYKGMIRARMENGLFQNCNLYGLDDATLIGGPGEMVAGKLADLRMADSVIIDLEGATDKLARPNPVPGKPKIPIQIGDTLELNDHRAVVVGICKGSRTFQSQPNVFTTYSRAVTFAPRERKLLSFILVNAEPGMNLETLCRRITEKTGLSAYTADQFKMMTVNYFLKYTGIPINFGIAVSLGFLVGTLITGFMFYSFTIDNLKFLGTLKAMGTSDAMLMRMILLQALAVGLLGFGIGVGAATLFGVSMKNTQLAFWLTWQLLVVSMCAVVIICMLAAMLSVRKVVALEPAVVFKG